MQHRDIDIDSLRARYLAFFEEKGHLEYPSSSLRSDDPTLMFTSAGMVQFKPYFLGATPKFAGFPGVHHRVTTAQKCLRINDIENVGRTLRHHSFFEMLGNFSFGDYFKKEAALWAWEFLVDRLGFDADRLYVTVYEDDDRAFEVWRDEVGVPPERISRWGEDENFWPANAVSDGPNGPCGPCSEIFYDRGPEFGTPDETGPNTGSGDRFIEIWNLVFTQFDRQDGGVLEPLPQQNIDTGLGFERLVAVLSGREDAYATDLFQPTIRKVAELSGRAYEGTESVSHRVIADHIRAVTFAITDGVLPANDGAGYVVKMLLRRASRHAWLLGLREPVLHRLVDEVVTAMGGAYPEIADGRERVRGIVRAEEEQFLRTLESGIERVRTLLSELAGDTLPGDVAFDLWQTHGFPLDLTREMAEERGISVDRAGYEAAREEARKASRGDKEQGALFSASRDTLGRIAEANPETAFVGYRDLEAGARVVAIVANDDAVDALREGERGMVILDTTPFYAEGGGQIGDAGELTWGDGGAAVSTTTKSPQGLYLHDATVTSGTLQVGAQVSARVDPRRTETEKHHTATHLLHAALRSVLGTHVAQAGSLVADDRLRFDFSHPQAVTAEEQRRIEELVNRWVQADFEVGWRVVSIADAREQGAMMLFGEKYGSEVRMVSVGRGAAAEGQPEQQAVSIELCGGTHVRRTGEIGGLVITTEEAVSAGVRRIIALAGMASVSYHQALRRTTLEAAQSLGAKPGELIERIEKLQADVKAAQRESQQLRDKLAAAQVGAATGSGSGSGSADASVLEEAGGYTYAARGLDGLDASALRNAADTLLQKTKADIVVVGSGKLLAVKVSDAAQERGLHAGNVIRELAKRGGGGGGGRPDMAQAGVADEGRLRDALDAVPEVLRA